ncbi:dihydrofolate reductase [Georgenia subflava]|uniref:Dihydrofolate reductase n=1 Tax=Georgenia subflava TaxID=1622177 RepID=A0A6N7EN22_9MICO|nr:dihydrofolate reductase [Georgenia subflava]MPV38493.1 dihydrofolate reductase [Georgenia subflava]
MIWAQAHDRVIGADGAMPWRLPEDLAHFRRTTTGTAVVMGRTTWESFPARFRPLPGRRNIVLSRQSGLELPGAEVAHDLEAALRLVGDSDVWVIGGAQVYAEAMPRADRLVVTDIDLDVDGDARAPRIEHTAWVPERTDPDDGWHTSETGLRYRITTYVRPPLAARGR